MPENILERLFEHNNWANLEMIRACQALSGEQLDAEPGSATKGTIRTTIIHLVSSQRGYLRLLTLPLEERLDHGMVPFEELEDAASRSGDGFLALMRKQSTIPTSRIETRDGYLVEPWVVMVQAINHATEHREQISSMLTKLGVSPPDLDGWSYGEATNAVVPNAR